MPSPHTDCCRCYTHMAKAADTPSRRVWLATLLLRCVDTVYKRQASGANGDRSVRNAECLGQPITTTAGLCRPRVPETACSAQDITKPYSDNACHKRSLHNLSLTHYVTVHYTLKSLAQHHCHSHRTLHHLLPTQYSFHTTNNVGQEPLVSELLMGLAKNVPSTKTRSPLEQL